MTTRELFCDVDLDWCTYYCPCGESLCTREYIRRNDDKSINEWIEKHKEHTNGSVRASTNSNGARAYGGIIPPDEVRTL